MEETEAIRVLEGGGGHYLGTMAGPVTGPSGTAFLPGRAGFSIPQSGTIAHELGHNLGLRHAPCGGAGDPDPSFPHPDGSAGAWGYDFARGELVRPETPDLMSYCGPPDGISDYHFANALRYRLFEARAAVVPDVAPARSLLLWGGANADGAPFLNPVFVVEARPALPDSAGAYTLTGRTARGTELFSFRFAMPRAVDGDGGSGFAFVLPAELGWADELAGITLAGPGGTFALNADSDIPTAILRDPRTGRVRGILRDLPPRPRPRWTPRHGPWQGRSSRSCSAAGCRTRRRGGDDGATGGRGGGSPTHRDGFHTQTRTRLFHRAEGGSRMTRNRLGLRARFLMVATAVACWIPCVPAPAAGMPLPQQVPGQPTGLTATAEGTSIRLNWQAPTSGGSPTGYRIEMYSNADPQWVEVDANTGVPAITYLHANPPRNTIVWYRVAAINATGTGDYSFSSNTVNTAGGTGPVTPGAPRNLTAVAVGTAIDLNWDEPFPTPGKTISGYQVNVSTNGGVNFAFLANTTASEYRHSGLPVGATRHYEVRALYSDNTVGPPAYANATTVATGIPDAPRNLSATAAGPTAIDVDWDAPASPGASAIIDYQVEVSTTGGVPWTLLTTTGQTSFRHTNLTAGATRHYRVRARNANDFGPWTSVVSATTSTGTAPGPPRDLTATAVSSSAIELSWSPPGSGGSSAIIGYRIERSRTRTGGWGEIEDDTGNTRTTYRDTGLSPNTTYYYRVSAINSFATGDPSNIDDATTEPDVPDAPGRLTAQARGISVIELAWRAPSSSGTSRVTGYQIQWSSRGTGGWRDLEDDTGNTRTTYQDTNLAPNTTRYYRVRAISGAGSSAWSNVADATTDDLTVPGAPRSLTVSPNGLKGSTELRLSWAAPVDSGGSPITGYRIERAVVRGGAWIIHVASTGSATTTYLDTGLTPNTTRFYRVRALNAQGHGDPSNVAEGTTNAARPGQPQNLRARATGPTSITLAWERPASDGGERITGYTIRRSGSKDGPWITIVRNTGSTATTFTNTGLQPATSYWYQVAAINRVGPGQWSFQASTSTYAQAPGAPVGLTARAVGTARIDLSWSAPRNTGGAPILGYRIEASDDGGSTWRIVRRNTSSTGTTFSDVNLQPATTRHYRVAALNTAGTGPFSNTARATTEATVPGTPRNLDAEADGTSRIELSWREPTSDGGSRITGYRIEVSEDGGARWDDLVSNSHNTRTTYVHTGLEPATRRHYRVSAINREGVGRASRVVSAITDATVPDAPTGLTATAVSPTRIDLFWLAPAYDGGAPVTGYRIEVSENATAWTDLMVNTGSRATTFSHTGLQPGSTRHYRVSAINRVGPARRRIPLRRPPTTPSGARGD